MLNPSMQDLMKKVNNRYLLVNLAAQRARDIALEAMEAGDKIPEKPVKQALDEIAAGKVVYREGPKPEPEPAPKLDDMLASAVLTAEDDIVMEDAAADNILEEL
ncbi:MAG: DNA-directed RNA polymerase subunit omega [Butyricicoccus sp.]